MASMQRIVLRIAATAERFSEHPLARAIVKRANEWTLPIWEPSAFRYRALSARWKPGGLKSLQQPD